MPQVPSAEVTRVKLTAREDQDVIVTGRIKRRIKDFGDTYGLLARRSDAILIFDLHQYDNPWVGWVNNRECTWEFLEDE